MNPFSFVRLALTSFSVRLRRTRPGSVLIIVIILLLLLAMMGAAFVSTTRSSRVASAQNVMNSDVDLMLDGISKVCDGIIVDDLNDNFGNLNGNVGPGASANQGMHETFRGAYATGQKYVKGDIVSFIPSPATPPLYTPPYFFVAVADNSTQPALGAITPWLQTTHVPGVTSSLIQPWLAERIPTPDGLTGTLPQLAYWPNITQMPVPVGGTLATSVLGTPFESPDGTTMPTLAAGSALTGQIGTNLVPIFKSIGDIYVPALKYGGTQCVAGDADGDGIADSLLFRIPGTNNDGLTWYAAVRIIDNNSAINLNTALSRDYEYALSGGTLKTSNPNYYSLFATSVGVAELLHPGDSPTPNATSGNFANFNAYRVGAGATIQPQADATPGGANPLLPVTRPDIQFLNAGDLLNNQLVRRIANPGFNGNGNRCATLPLSDQAALAYRFCLVNPETASSQVSASLSENLLPFSLASWVPTGGSSPQYYRSAPFGNNGTPSDTDVNQWFNDNFNYDSPTGTADYGSEPQPVRALLVTRNPVSSAITPVYDSTSSNTGEPIEPLGSLGAVSNPYTAPANTISGMMLPYGTGPGNYVHFKGAWNQGQVSTYQFNDIVVGGDGHTYIFVNPATTPLPADHTSSVWVTAPTLQNLPPSAAIQTGLGLYQYWQYQPWSKTPAKANVNTATFRELYRSFWSVMAGNPSNQTPFGTSVDPNPYWVSASPSQPNPQHQFRSPLRDPTYTSSTPLSKVTRLDPENTMLLRAALAAVNTLGLRDASQNIVSRTVYLQAMIAAGVGQAATPQSVMARVYSNAPQPVISEVYVNSYRGTDSGDSSILNDRGYVAVELYNPYSVPMVLKNWQLGLIKRSSSDGSYYGGLTFVQDQDVNGKPGQMVSVIAPPNQQKNSFTLQAQNDPRIDPKNSQYDLPKPVAGLIILPAHGYALLENYNQAASPPDGNSGDAFGRPASAGFVRNDNTIAQKGIWCGPDVNNPNTCDVYVPGLQLVIPGSSGSTTTRLSSPGGELVLLRPRRSDGMLTSSGTPTNPSASPAVAATDDPLDTFDEGTTTDPNLYDLVPVDSFDFTGLQPLGGPSDPGQAWSYVRTKGDKDHPDTWFRQIYPGRYSLIDATTPREAGTDHHAVPNEISWTKNATPAFGKNVSTGNCCYMNNFPPIQIYNTYNTYDTAYAANTVQAHWANPTVFLSIPTTDTGSVEVATSAYAQYPYGAFARNGDMLDITFIGAYRISQVSATVNPNPTEPTNFVELNSLPRDCSFADATYDDSVDVADQKYENIGRFCPIQARPAPALPAKWLQPDYYAWTSNLYSYLTVQSLPDATLPNFDANISDVASEHPSTNPLPPAIALPYYKYAPSSPTSPPPVPASTPPPAPLPAMVLTADPTASDQTNQGSVGVDGLININTASWKVLSMLPMITTNEDPGGTAPNYNYIKDNESFAKAIVSWRINHGPFTSIYDLNSVVDGASGTNGLQNAEGHLAIANGGATNGVSSLNGLMSPPDPAFPSVTAGGKASGLSEDYQSDFAMLSRISNLITTRSDTFTVYIEIQGWQNVGTASAQPMITRHYAYIVDRSAINSDPSSRFLKTLTVPKN